MPSAGSRNFQAVQAAAKARFEEEQAQRAIKEGQRAALEGFFWRAELALTAAADRLLEIAPAMAKTVQEKAKDKVHAPSVTRQLTLMESVCPRRAVSEKKTNCPAFVLSTRSHIDQPRSCNDFVTMIRIICRIETWCGRLYGGRCFSKY